MILTLKFITAKKKQDKSNKYSHYTFDLYIKRGGTIKYQAELTDKK